MVFFLMDLTSIGIDEIAGDNFACTGSIVLFCGIMLFETEKKIHPAAPVCFIIASLSWGLFLRPAAFNRCHLPLWLLLIEAFRNFLTVDAHATFLWSQAVFRSVLSM